MSNTQQEQARPDPATVGPKAHIDALQASVAAKRRARVNGGAWSRGESRVYRALAIAGGAVLGLAFLSGMAGSLVDSPFTLPAVIGAVTIKYQSDSSWEGVRPLTRGLSGAGMLGIGLGLGILLQVPIGERVGFAMLVGSLIYAWSAPLFRRS